MSSPTPIGGLLGYQQPEENTVHPGTYVDRNGDNVRVTRTETGLMLRWADGRTALVAA